MPMAQNAGATGPEKVIPDWLPDAARHYLAHVGAGRPIRALAREEGVHASTILRQVRKLEALRDDPLVDEALREIGVKTGLPVPASPQELAATGAADARPDGENLRILRRLAEAGTMLVVGRDMDMAVVLREGIDGQPQRLAVVARQVASDLALKDWISCPDPQARILRYAITANGRAALRRAMVAPFSDDDAEDPRRLRHMRSTLLDSPVTALARRQDKSGKPFLTRNLVVAAERLREDYELSRGSYPAGTVLPPGAQAAEARLQAALDALGAGLADVALHCCCYLEGMESIESRMEWSARSGKVVLRIALQRLEMHYAATSGPYAPKIGHTVRC